MLETLQVKNLAVIREAEVEFGAGLNILTGETGAGKSVILGGVNLAMGCKASREMIRGGAREASCTLVFRVDDPEKREEILEEGFELEEDRLILSRRMQQSKNVCRIGGEMVNTSKLREVSAGLIDIHGQQDSRFLLNKKYHLHLVDDYRRQDGADILERYREAYHRYQNLDKELRDNDCSEEERLREMSFLEYEIREITDAALREGEDDALEEQYRTMSHAQQVMEALSKAHSMAGSDGAGEALQQAARAVSSVTRYGADLKELYDQVSEVSALIDDLERALRETMEAYTFRADEFAAVQERLNEINGLKRKYGRTIPDILSAMNEKCERLDQLRSLQDWKEKTQRERDIAYETAQTLAEKLHEIRLGKAAELEVQISQTLMDLNFLQAQFKICVETVPPGENGTDSIAFLISTNPGEALKPLEKTASGGELSRIMLALRTVSARQEGSQTLIFDEIDAGISGRTAQKAGELLKRLSKTNQIICITHLPQIAAMADRHYVIEKTVDDDQTISSIRLLGEEESTRELARMLGGAKITETVMRSAREMKEQAAQLS